MQELRLLIFGSPSVSFNDEWRLQGFAFCDTPGLQFGIVQKKVRNASSAKNTKSQWVHKMKHPTDRRIVPRYLRC